MTVESQLPLPSLLLQVLVAFTIEFDNEFEHRTPHRTSTEPAANNPRNLPWLVSLAMWSNFMRFVPEDGISVRELQRLTGHANVGMRQWLTRMEPWWGYVVVRPDPADSRPARGSEYDTQYKNTHHPRPSGSASLRDTCYRSRVSVSTL